MMDFPLTPDESRHGELLDKLDALLLAYMAGAEQDPRPVQVDVSELVGLIGELRDSLVSVAAGRDDRMASPTDVRWEWTSIGSSLEQQVVPLYRGVAPAGSSESDPVWQVTLFVGDERGPQREDTRVGSWSKRYELFR